jgi:coenzyme F420 hydrogenase subunit beta
MPTPSLSDISSGKYDSNLLITPYEKLFIGYSKNKGSRKIGSSGGVGTELNRFVLESGLVDAVVGVGFSREDPTLPEYRVIEDPKDVAELSGSKYVYMEFKPLLQLLALNKNKNISLFVQPCFVKAIRALQRKKYPNIKYIFSFFCGYNITYEGTEYLIGRAKLKREQVETMSYRWGDYPGGFMVKQKNAGVVNFGKECYELIDLMFLKKSCKNCSYYMGEGADVALGDAWAKNLKKASLLITRNNAGSSLIEKMHSENKIMLYELREPDLIKMHWHNLKFKKYGLSPFLNFLHICFRTNLAKKLLPFKFMSFLSRNRRKLAIGMNVNLHKIKSISKKNQG